MIGAEHIEKRFGDRTVLRDVSFQVPEGQIYGLVGYNGVGKTTLLKILCGIYRPDRGRATVDGTPVYEHPEVKRRCFFMTEEATFFDQASLSRMRRFYRGCFPRWSDAVFHTLVEWFGLDPDGRIIEFSKGMQRQASLALAFSCGADCLFLDEAFDGLDFTLRRQMRRMLAAYARVRQASLVVSSHNLSELEDLADRIGLLRDGELIFSDATDRMREEWQTCRFVLPEGTDLAPLDAELTEREGGGWLCVVRSDREEALRRLTQLGAEEIQIRPVRLEEFFRKDRGERSMDWEELFRV